MLREILWSSVLADAQAIESALPNALRSLDLFGLPAADGKFSLRPGKIRSKRTDELLCHSTGRICNDVMN